MPLGNIPAGLPALIASKDYEFHAAIDIVLGTGTTVHLSTAPLSNVTTRTFGVVDYTDDLRESGQLSESVLLTSTNRMDLRAQNVDGVLGKILSKPKALNGAKTIISIIYINNADTKFQLEVLHGEASNARQDDPHINFQVIAYTSSDGPIGGYRTLQNACFNRYKIEIRCGSLSPLGQSCSKLLEEGVNGCKDHLPAANALPEEIDNRFRFTGFLFKKPALPGTPPSGETGIVDMGDDFTSFFNERQSIGEYTGRYSVPKYKILM